MAPGWVTLERATCVSFSTACPFSSRVCRSRSVLLDRLFVFRFFLGLLVDVQFHDVTQAVEQVGGPCLAAVGRVSQQVQGLSTILVPSFVDSMHLRGYLIQPSRFDLCGPGNQ